MHSTIIKSMCGKLAALAAAICVAAAMRLYCSTTPTAALIAFAASSRRVDGAHDPHRVASLACEPRKIRNRHVRHAHHATKGTRPRNHYDYDQFPHAHPPTARGS